VSEYRPRASAGDLDTPVPAAAQGKSGAKGPSALVALRGSVVADGLDARRALDDGDRRILALEDVTPYAVATIETNDGRLVARSSALRGLDIKAADPGTLSLVFARPPGAGYRVIAGYRDGPVSVYVQSSSDTAFTLAAWDMVAGAAVDLAAGRHRIGVMVLAPQ
jgi:hypothetical protein